MTSRDFCYWLQGYFEINAGQQAKDYVEWVNPQQVEMIKNHLAMVFKHEIDPSFGDKKHQEELTKLHDAFIKGGEAKLNC